MNPVVRHTTASTPGREGLTFWCPGCQDGHRIEVSLPGQQAGGWSFNGNDQAPTFQPSVLVRSGHYCDSHKPEDPCWCTANAKREAEGKPRFKFACYRCHSFVKDGQIQFLGDCTHALANQTVPLPPIDQWPSA